MPVSKLRGRLAALAAVAVFSLASSASAGTVTWTDWTSATIGDSGSAAGTMGGISVTYSGEVELFQTGGASDYSTADYYSPSGSFLSATVSNKPTAREMIGINTPNITNTITFSSAVLNPVMAFVSVGRTNAPVTYDFDDAPFTVLSGGGGYWGGGSVTTNSTDDSLTGREWHGVIQFQGSFSSISWTTNPGEFWHGITVGDVSVVPLPPAAFLGLGLLGGLGLIGRLRKRRSA